MSREPEELLKLDLGTAVYRFVYWQGIVQGYQRFSPTHAQFFLEDHRGQETLFNFQECPQSLGLRDGHELVFAALDTKVKIDPSLGPKFLPFNRDARSLQTDVDGIAESFKLADVCVQNLTIHSQWKLDEDVLRLGRKLGRDVCSVLFQLDEDFPRKVAHELKEGWKPHNPHIEELPKLVRDDNGHITERSGKTIPFRAQQVDEDGWVSAILSGCCQAVWKLQEEFDRR